MKLVYSRRALADIEEIASYYSINASPAVAGSIERRLIEVIERIRRTPEPLRVSRNVRAYAPSPLFAILSGFSIGYATTASISYTFDTRRDGPQEQPVSMSNQGVQLSPMRAGER
jgi:hypothetical protein